MIPGSAAQAHKLLNGQSDVNTPLSLLYAFYGNDRHEVFSETIQRSLIQSFVSLGHFPDVAHSWNAKNPFPSFIDVLLTDDLSLTCCFLFLLMIDF